MAKGLPKVANYVKNAGKSLAFAAIDSVSESIEGIKEFADTNNDVFKEVYAGVRNYRQTMKKAHKTITQNKTFVAVQTGLKNMRDDLKSGQFYHNRDYSDEIMGMDDMEAEFGFTITSSEDGESSSSSRPSETVASVKMLSNSFDQAIGAATDAQCKTIVNGVEVVTRSHEASTRAMIAAQERSAAMISSSVGALYSEVSTITKFMNTTMVAHMNNSRRFYEEQIKASQELVAMQKELLEMQRNLYAQQQRRKDTTFEDAFTASGGMNIKGYAKAIKKNVQTHVLDALGLSMMGGGGMNPLMMWAQNPWQPILSGLMGMFIPKNFKESLKNFDKSLSSAFSTFIAHANAAGKEDDGSILSFLGKIFGIDLKEKKKIDTASYKKDAVSFDGITRQSIIETIPGYLARIEAALTGGGERFYDFQSGSWKSAKQVQVEHENRRNLNATSAGMDLRYALEPYIAEMAKISAANAEEFKQQIAAMNKQVFEDGGAFMPKKNDSYYYGMSKANMDYLLKLGRDDPKVRQAIQGLTGRHMSARQSQNRYMEQEEMNGGITRILYNHTFEGNNGPGAHGGNKAGGTGLLSLSKDADGHNVFWYLKEILKTLGNKIPARKTRAERRRERRSRGRSGSTSSSGLSSSDDGDGGSDPDSSIFDEEDITYMTDDELYAEIKKRQEEEEAQKNPTKKLGDKVREKFGNSKAGQFLASMADKFGTVISAPMDYMTKLLNKADQNLFKLFFGNEEMVDKDGNKIDSVFNYIIAKVKEAFEGLHKWFKEKFDPLKDKVKEKLKPLWDKYGAPVKNAMGDMFKAGKNRVKLGFHRTLGHGMDTVATAFNERTINVKEHEFAKKAAEIGFDEEAVYNMVKEQGITATTKFLYQQAEGSPEARKAIVALGKQYRTDISRVNTRIKSRKAKRDQIISELEKGGVKTADEIKKETSSDTKGEPSPEDTVTSAYGRLVTKRGLTMISPGEIIIPASTDPSVLNQMENLERRDRSKIMNYIGLNAKGTFNTEAMKSNLYKIYEENKDPAKASRVGAGGILGAGAGLLMGNPLLGALAGAGLSVLQNSETLKTMLFGKKDKDGEREGGIIPKSVTDIFKKYGKDMGDFGIAGGLLGLFTPFGVLGGAAIGAGIGYLKNNDSFKKFVFGDAETGEDGLISKETTEKAKKFFKKSVPAMGIGAVVGMLTGPFGLLGNAVLGAGAGLLTSTSAFHKFIFGDPDNPKKGSLVGAIKNGILNPAKERIKKIFDDLTEWGKKKVLDPLKNFGKELGIAIKNAVTNTFDKVKDFLNGMFEKTIGIPIHDFLQEKIFKPITKTFFNILKAPLAIGKAIIGAPFKAMGAAADHMKKKRVRTGQAGEMTAQERLDFRKEKKMGKDRFTEQDTVIAGMSEDQLKSTEELIKGRMAAREAAGKNLGAVRQQMGEEISSFFNSKDASGVQMYDKVGYNKVKKIAKMAAEGDEGAYDMIDDLKGLSKEEKDQLKSQIKDLLDKTYKENADFRKVKDELAKDDKQLEEVFGRRIKGNSDLLQMRRAMSDEQKARLKKAKKDGESGKTPEPPTDPAEATNLFKNVYEERTKTIIEKIAESNALLKAILNPKAAVEDAKKQASGSNLPVLADPSISVIEAVHGEDSIEAVEAEQKAKEEDAQGDKDSANYEETKNAIVSIKDKLFGSPKDKGKKKGGILGKIGDAIGGVFSFLGGSKVGKALGIGATVLGGVTFFGMFGEFFSTKILPPIKKLLFGSEESNTDGLIGGLWNKVSTWFNEKFPDGFGGIVRDGVQYIADNFQKVCDNVIQPIIEVLLNNAPVFIAGLVKALVSALKNIKWGQSDVGDRASTDEYDVAASGIAGALGKTKRTNTVEMAQVTDEKGNPLYYTDETQTETTTKATDYPVMEVVSGYTKWNETDSVASKMASAGGEALVRSAAGIGTSGVGKLLTKVSAKGVGKGVVKVATAGTGTAIKGAGATVVAGQNVGNIIHNVAEASTVTTAAQKKYAEELAKITGQSADDIMAEIGEKGLTQVGMNAAKVAKNAGDDAAYSSIAKLTRNSNIALKNNPAIKTVAEASEGTVKKVTGNIADDLAEGGIKQAAKGVVSNAADNVGSKITNGLTKIFSKIANSKIGSKILAACSKNTTKELMEKALEKIAKKLGEKIMSSLAGKAITKVASAIAGFSPLAIAIWVKDFLHGFSNADTILGVTKGDTEFEVNIGHKIVCGLLELLTNQFTFGLLPSEVIVDICIEFLFPLMGLDTESLKAARERSQAIMDEWNEAHPEEQYDNLEDFNNKDKLHVRIGKTLKETQIGEQVENVKQVGGGAIQMFKDAGSTIKNIFSGIKNGNLNETMAPLMESLKGFPKWIGAAFKNLWTSAVTGEDSEESQIADDDPLKGIKNVIEGIMKVVTCPITSIAKLFTNFKENISKMWDSLKKFGSFIWQGTKNVFAKAWEGDMLGAFQVKANQENERGFVGTLANVVFSVLKIAASPIIYMASMVGKVKNFVMNAIECGKVIIPILGTMVGELFKKAWTGEDYEVNIATTGNDMIDNVMKGVFGIVKVVTFVPRTIAWAAGRIVQVVKVVIDAGKQMIPKLATAVGGLFTAAWKGEESPTKVESTGNTLLDIINNAIFNVVKVISTPVRIITSIIGTVVSFFTDGIEGIKKRFEPVTNAFNWIKEKIMGVFNSITEFFENTFGKIKSFFGGGNWGLPDIGAGISNAWDTVKGWFGGAGDKHLYQSDPTIARRTYGPTTIGENGCAPVAATNAINNVRGKSISLNEAASHAESNGFLNKEGMTDMKYFESIFNKYGIRTQVTNDSSLIMEALKHGHQVVMLGMDTQGNSNSPYGSRPHYITGVGLDPKGNVIVEDPDMPQSRVSYDPRRVMGTTMSATVTSEKIDAGGAGGTNALTESRRAAATNYGSARALDSYENTETPVVVHSKNGKAGGSGSVSYEVFLETIVTVLMTIASNTGLLAKILELLSERLDLNISKEEVRKVVDQNSAGTKAALAKLIQKSGDADAARVIGNKDTDYLLRVMNKLAAE